MRISDGSSDVCSSDLHRQRFAPPPPHKWGGSLWPLPTPKQSSCPRMRIAVDIEQMRGIDRGIDLRRRKARMAEQFLQTPQIRPARQQVRRETEIGRASCRERVCQYV